MASALVTVNGSPCIRATCRLPRAGVWFADLVVDATSALSGRVSISVADGRLELRGTATRTGVFKDTAILRVLAGAGGMGKTVSAKFFRGAAVRTVLQHILGAAGEQLSGATESKVLERQLAVYTVRQQAAGAALSQLAEHLGVTWRALPDGSIWLGEESWPEASLPNADILEQDPRAQTVTIGTDSPTLQPGVVWGGRKVSMVEHVVSADQVRSTLWLEQGSGGLGDRLTQAVRAIVSALTAHMDYFAVYPAKVVSQNSDGTLELQPDDKRLPGLTKVPIRYGIPGVTAKVAKNARVIIEFENGLPTLPVASLWEPGSLKELVITADTRVSVVCSDVRFGSETADKALALAEKVASELSKQATFNNSVSTHTHEVATTGTAAAQSGTAAPSTALTSTPSFSDTGTSVAKTNA